MDRIRGLWRKARAIVWRGQADRDLDEEIGTHLAMATDRFIAEGHSRADAARLARAHFGTTTAVREAHREARGGRWLDDAVADTRYAFRTLRHNPALTAAAVLTIALGVGANTAIFSALHAVVLRPLPFREPDRLVMVWEENRERGWYQAEAAPANVLDWREQVAAFADVAMYPSFGATTVLSHDGEARLLTSMNVSGNFFDVLGVPAALGRTFTTEETFDTGERVAMISHRLWRTRFGADPAIVNRTIDLGGFPVRVIGVVGERFSFPGRDADVFRPTAFDRQSPQRTSFRRAHWMRAIARLEPGVGVAQANSALQLVVQRLQQQYPETNTGMGAGLTPLHRALVGDVRQPLLALQVAVALLLLIATANVGNLLLVRAADRERESVVRLALGAGHGRLVRQAFTESVVLSALGGLAGIALGWTGTRVLAALQPAGMLPVTDVRVNWTVLSFGLAVSVASGLLFAIGPAMWTRRRAPAEVLKEGGRGASRSRLRRWSHAVAVAQVAIALVLLAGAGLLVRSWWRVQSVNPGFDPGPLLAVEVTLPPGRFGEQASRNAFFNAALERLRGVPGVAAATTVSRLPMTEAGWSSDFAVAGRPREAFGIEVVHRDIAAGYHDVIGVKLLRGRAFTPADNAEAASVVMINEALARKYFPNEDPVGQRVAFDRYPDSTSFWRTIVGVVGNERQQGLEQEVRPEFFAPVLQDENGPRTFVLRTTVPPASVVAGVRSVIQDISGFVAVNRVVTLDEVRDAALARRRFVMTIAVSFALSGLLLALVGVYGVMAQLARGRRREIGIRMALGAPSIDIRTMVVRHSLVLAGTGVAIGFAVTAATTGAMRSLLFGVSPLDPGTIALASVVLVVAAVASSVPSAWRATHVDPTETLRAD